MADEIGGISAKVELDDTDLAAQSARIKARLDALAAKYGQTADAVATATTKVDTAMKQVANGSQSTAMKMLVLGQVVDDIQYGFGAIVNQVPQLVMALGGTAGLAGGLSIAAVAANQLILHWDDLERLLGMRHVETAAEEMERLGKETHKTADEQERYNKLKREEQTYRAVVEGKSKEDSAVEAAVRSAIAEAGGRDLVKGLLERQQVRGPRAEMTEQDRLDLEAAAERDRKRKGAPDPFGLMEGVNRVAEVTKRINDRLADENRQLIKTLLDQAIEGVGRVGEEARKALRNIIAENPGAFPAGLGPALARAEGAGEGKSAVASSRAAEQRASFGRIKDIRRQEEREAKEEDDEETQRMKAVRDFVRDRDAKRAADAREADQAAKEEDHAETERMKAVRGFVRDRDARRAKEAGEAVKDAPLLGERAKLAALGAMQIGGMDPAQAEAFVKEMAKQELMAGGADEKAAELGAKDVARGARRSIEEDAMAQRLGLRGGGGFTNSTMMGIGQLGQAVQGAVTNNPNIEKDQLEALLAMQRGIEAIRQKLPVVALQADDV